MCAWGQGDSNNGNSIDDRVRRLEERQKREESLARQPVTSNDGETVNPAILEGVLDNSIGIRFEEREGYFRILELARRTQLAKQEDFALNFAEARQLSNPRYAKRKPSDFPVFIDMFQNPEAYRGRPVSIHGVMRRLTKIDPGKNNQGIVEAYEGWVFTDDSQGNPAVVVFLDKPEGLKVGGDIAEEVRLTGYFFKMYGYQSQENVRKAPLILAGAVEWRKSPEPWRAQPLGVEVYLGITMISLLLGFVWWQGNRREMTSALRTREADFSQFPPKEMPQETVVGGTPLTEPHDS